jgi:hypothetical protein
MGNFPAPTAPVRRGPQRRFNAFFLGCGANSTRRSGSERRRCAVGQGALLLGDPAAAQNPFYLMAPDWARLCSR